MEDGIFANLRKQKINLLDNSFVNITASHDYWTKFKANSPDGTFCDVPNIEGGPPNVVVDGSLNKAHCSLDVATPGNRFINFDFKKNRVYIESFAIQTLCLPPKHLILEGSYDGTSNWFPIKEITTSLKANAVNKYDSTMLQSFPIIRLTQIGACDQRQTNYRMHIYNFELYGHLEIVTSHISCVKQMNIHYIIFLYNLLKIS